MSMPNYSGGPNPAIMASAMLAKWYNRKRPDLKGQKKPQPGQKPTDQTGGPATTPGSTTPTRPTPTKPKSPKTKEATIKDTKAAIKAGMIDKEEGVRISKGYAQQVAKKELADKRKAAAKKTPAAKPLVKPVKATKPTPKAKKSKNPAPKRPKP